MKSTSYLYDLNPEDLKNLTYQDALIKKIIGARKILNKLVRKEDMNDSERIKDVSDAIIFNKNLLKELGYQEREISMKLKLEESR